MKTMYKTKEEMTKVELFKLKLGHYNTGKIIKNKIYYKIDNG